MPVLSPEAQRKKTLMDLLKLPENQVCADCPEKGPRWACAKAGVFICIECSGIHRNLGTHLSKARAPARRRPAWMPRRKWRPPHTSGCAPSARPQVRSLNLDSWNDDWVSNMEKWLSLIHISEPTRP